MLQANPTPLASYRCRNCVMTLQIGQHHALCPANSQTISFAPAVRSASNKRSLPATCRKKEHSTESNSAHTNFFIKTPSTFLPAGELLGHNSGRYSPKIVPSLRRTQPDNSPSPIAQTLSRKKKGTIKSFGAALQAFVLHKKGGTNVNLCSLDDGILVHEKKTSPHCHRSIFPMRSTLL